jgi:Regulator of ribonuclease activity B
MDKKELKKQVEGHNDRNSELVAILAKKGIEKSDEIEADYHFWAFTHNDAIALAKRLYDEGYIVLVLSPVKEKEDIFWNLEARKREIVSEVINSENSENLVMLADTYDSTYDGWGTSV